MYTVYVFIKKGLIDWSKPFVPTRVYHCATLSEALKKKDEEETAFWKRAGEDNYDMMGGTLGRFCVYSRNTNEQILIEIVDK